MDFEAVTGIATAGAALVAVALEILVVVGGAMWVVHRLQITTAKLSTEIEHLADAVSNLHTDLSSIHGEISEIHQRLAVLESIRK